MEASDGTRSARKHRAILEAATGAFLSKGYAGTNMDEIAEEAAVSKRTVYRHFADKDGLFAEIVLSTTDEMAGLVQVLAERLAESLDVPRDLGELGRQFLAALMQPRLVQLRRLIIANADRFPELGRAWYEQGFARAIGSLAASFARLGERGRLSVHDPVLAAHHFVGQLLWIPMNEVMFTGRSPFASDADLDRYAVAAVAAFLSGYGRRPPRPTRRSSGVS